MRRALTTRCGQRAHWTSSTLRELQGVLSVVEAWGGERRGRVVRLCMDSFAATRNLIKGGGPVAELCALTKHIWQACEEHGLTLHPEWVPRENTYADKLSKAWENWFALSAAAWEYVQCALGRCVTDGRARNARVVNVPFNQLRNALHEAERKGECICIVHPRWEAQSWWPHLLAHRRLVIPLGAVSAVLQPTVEPAQPAPPPHAHASAAGGGRRAIAFARKPDWAMEASIVDFGRVAPPGMRAVGPRSGEGGAGR